MHRAVACCCVALALAACASSSPVGPQPLTTGASYDYRRRRGDGPACGAWTCAVSPVCAAQGATPTNASLTCTPVGTPDAGVRLSVPGAVPLADSTQGGAAAHFAHVEVPATCERGSVVQIANAFGEATATAAGGAPFRPNTQFELWTDGQAPGASVRFSFNVPAGAALSNLCTTAYYNPVTGAIPLGKLQVQCCTRPDSR